eukprot:TRINITY_DN6822_c0_g1_i1.p2 TRINITY_DN6822_c0_g1~~TRINITY_DN6822_c0_g1_i1.p2  ORF type:complete len:117 (-),score=18.69 TRINITY_DN6822_c0_g1_i1:111-461(-)
MPRLTVVTSAQLDGEQVAALSDKLSAALAEMLAKPLQYVMVAVQAGVHMRFGGSLAPAASLELLSIGRLGEEENKGYSARLCKLLQDEAGVSPDRVYIRFLDVERANLGWNGKTFA